MDGDKGVTLQELFDYLRSHGLDHWARRLEFESPDWLVAHGDYARWSSALETLPEINNPRGNFDTAAVTVDGDCADPDSLRQALRGLIPWRKGPYQVADVFIDSEWRSDCKWDRVLPHLAPLKDRRVLDIGCGNGYHCWRMLAHSPELVVGIEPSVLFNLQFRAIQRYLQHTQIQLLPIRVEEIPADLEWFDSVFSMGVFYHRRSPLDHLYQLKGALVSGGELCLETLVIEGEAGRILLPRDRYARMRNVWFIPSSTELVAWLERCGFNNVRLVDETVTALTEQRMTDWMQFESLAQCLDPNDAGLTIEGWPAPRFLTR